MGSPFGGWASPSFLSCQCVSEISEGFLAKHHNCEVSYFRNTKDDLEMHIDLSGTSKNILHKKVRYNEHEMPLLLKIV